MSALPAHAREPMAPHQVVESPDTLRRILEPGVNLCLWQRSPAPQISREVETLSARDLPDVRAGVTAGTATEVIDALLHRQGLPVERFPAWRGDMVSLVSLFAALAGERPVSLRLETTDSDGCTRFHADRTWLRLLCTYRGPGTEWLRNEQVNRRAQAEGRPNDEILCSGVASRFPTGTVGVMKGSRFPGEAGNGLVHRSPPLKGSGQVRVLFCLDAGAQ